MFPFGGVVLTNVQISAEGHLASFNLLGEDFYISAEAGHEEVIREDDRVVGASAWYWVFGQSGRDALASICAYPGSGTVSYFLDFWVEK